MKQINNDQTQHSFVTCVSDFCVNILVISAVFVVSCAIACSVTQLRSNEAIFK